MFKKIIASGVLLMAAIVGLVFANPHGGHHGLSIPPLPVVHLNLNGLLGLLKQPPIPIVKLPTLHLPHGHHGHHEHHGHHGHHGHPIPFISLPTSGHHDHHSHYAHPGHHDIHLPIGDLLNSIIGGNSWDSWA